MKLYSIEWPIPTTTKKITCSLGLGNFSNEFTQNNEDLTKPQKKRDKNEHDNNDMVMLPEGLFLNLTV
jgi:hypothetical protein